MVRAISQSATNVRVYLMAGTQHGTGPFPPRRGNGQEMLNPTNQSWVAERYPTRDAYLAKIREVTTDLVRGRYLLPEDVEAAVSRAGAHWDLIMNGDASSH